MHMLMAFFLQRKWHTTCLLTLVLTTSLFALMVPLVFSSITEIIVPRSYTRQFVLLMALLGFLIGVRMLVNFLQDYLFMKSRFLFEKSMLGLTISAHTHRKAAALNTVSEDETVARLSTFITNFQFNFSEIFYFILYSLLVSSSVLLIISFSSIHFLLLALTFLLIHYANLALHLRHINAASASYVESKSRFNARLNNLLDSKKIINIFHLTPYIEQLVGDEVSDVYQKQYQREQLVNQQELIQNLLKNLLFILMILLGIVAVHDQQLSVALVLLCVFLISFVYDPIYRLNAIVKAFAECKTQLAALLDKADGNKHETSLLCATEKPLPSRSIHQIELRDLALEHDGRVLFRGLNLVLQPGQLYLVDGPSGAGKSSLLRILAGLSLPSAGQVLWDGIDAKQFCARARPSLSLCPQNTHWADASVSNNISLFAPHSSESRVQEALHRAACDFISHASLVASDPLGDCWSGGQLRRLGVARVFYSDSSVLLLDEPTANMDATVEEVIIKQITSLATNRIVVFCSHSPALKAIADIRITLNSNGCQSVPNSTFVTPGNRHDL